MSPVTEDDGAGGWPDIVGDTALTIKVPEADPLVRAGFPAHITVLYPFLHVSRMHAAVSRELGELLGSHEAFEVSLGEFGRFPGVLFLDPFPRGPIEALTKEVSRRWPEAEPYRGIFDGALDPHLTIANSAGPDSDDAAYDALQAELEPALPISARVDAVHLIVWDGSGWRDRVAYPLRRPSAACTR